MKKISDSVKQMDLYSKKLPSLRDEYIKALKDDSFKTVISSIDIEEEQFMKYTSQLQECAREIEVCSKCKGLIECKSKVEGFIYTPSKGHNKIMFSYVACPYKQDQLENNSYQDNVYLFDIPKEIKRASMKDIYKDDKNRFEVIKWVKEFIDNYSIGTSQKGLYLNGNFGCGKTYLVAALFNELAKKGIYSAIVYWPEFLRSLKASFNEGFAEKFDDIKKIPLLLIDDIGAENTTAWSRDEILGPILQYRMQEQLPTFFTSNLSITELESHFSIANGNVEAVKARRIIERIKQLTVDKQLISKNRRE